jgi:hypothetical protein
MHALVGVVHLFCGFDCTYVLVAVIRSQTNSSSMQFLRNKIAAAAAAKMMLLNWAKYIPSSGFRIVG